MRQNIPLLSDEQAAAMMEGTWGRTQERDRQMLTFLLNTGLKINEFVRLNLSAVYTGARVRKTLTIPAAGG